MSLADNLKPKNTEEVKPGLFIQKYVGGYRQVYPSAWDGKVIWKNFLFGGKPLKGFIWFAIILFLVWAYTNDSGGYRDFYNTFTADPIGYCSELINRVNQEVVCTEFQKEAGLCMDPSEFDPSIIQNFLQEVVVTPK